MSSLEQLEKLSAETSALATDLAKRVSALEKKKPAAQKGDTPASGGGIPYKKELLADLKALEKLLVQTSKGAAPVGGGAEDSKELEALKSEVAKLRDQKSRDDYRIKHLIKSLTEEETKTDQLNKKVKELEDAFGALKRPTPVEVKAEPVSPKTGDVLSPPVAKSPTGKDKKRSKSPKSPKV
jgi:DNA repair exonuclease SbcCD ATPase subunit